MENNAEPGAASKKADCKLGCQVFRAQTTDVRTTAMEVDDSTKVGKSISKGRIEKRRSNRKAAIVFPKYKNGKRTGPKAKKQKIY